MHLQGILGKRRAAARTIYLAGILASQAPANQAPAQEKS
jgi:hypothetical protein